jgi:hypothetical protein
MSAIREMGNGKWEMRKVETPVRFPFLVSRFPGGRTAP